MTHLYNETAYRNYLDQWKLLTPTHVVRDVIRIEPSPKRDWLNLDPAMRGKAKPIAMADIIALVSRACQCEVNELRSLRRHKPVARARQIAMALAKEFTELSLPNIGRFLGGRDHSTVLHGIRKAKTNPAAFEPELSVLRNLLASRRDEA